jgi:hypothetical protein
LPISMLSQSGNKLAVATATLAAEAPSCTIRTPWVGYGRTTIIADQ